MSNPDIIISDTHIGSPFCNYDAFSSFLQALPDDSRLFLNGDTIDNPQHELPPQGKEAIEAILALSHRIRDVIWLYGNHDDQFLPSQLDHLQIARSLNVGTNVYLTHGDGFDRVMTRHRWFLKLFHALHNIRVALGASPVHVAEYAKKWSWLFNVLRRTVMANAVAHAKQYECSAVVCGHVHCAEETEEDGITYLNCGSWTESEFYYVLVEDTDYRLCRFHPGDPIPPVQ